MTMDTLFQLRISTVEKARWEAEATRCGFSLSEFVRRSVNAFWRDDVVVREWDAGRDRVRKGVALIELSGKKTYKPDFK